MKVTLGTSSVASEVHAVVGSTKIERLQVQAWRRLSFFQSVSPVEFRKPHQQGADYQVMKFYSLNYQGRSGYSGVHEIEWEG